MGDWSTKRIDIDSEVLSDMYMVRKMPVTEIAKEFGTCAATIRRKLKRIGVFNKSRHKVDIDEALLTKMYMEDRIGIVKIAKEMNLNVITVRRRLKELGIYDEDRRKVLFDDGMLRKMYEEEHMSVNAIANKLGSHSSTIKRKMEKAGILKEGCSIYNCKVIDRERIREMHVKERKNAKQIADELGINYATVRKKLKGVYWKCTDLKRVEVEYDEIRRMHLNEGMNANEIAHKLGIRRNVIVSRLNEIGVYQRGKRGSLADKGIDNKIIKMRMEDKMSFNAIGEALGVSGDAVRKRLMNLGVHVPEKRPDTTKKKVEDSNLGEVIGVLNSYRDAVRKSIYEGGSSDGEDK